MDAHRLWSLETFRGYSLRATDGNIGSVRDILFDDTDWKLRYLVVDTGHWLPGRKVLIATSVLGEPDPGRREFPVDETRDQVRHGPDIDTERPISRREEARLHGHFGWSPYWIEGPVSGMPIAAPGGVISGTPVRDYPAAEREAEMGSRMREEQAHRLHLRSGRAVEGYRLAALDGEIGHVEDLLIDGDDWRIRYFVADTRNWLPGRSVLIATDWVRGVDGEVRHVEVDLTQREIRESPAHDRRRPITRDDEAALYRHYGRRPYW